MKIVHVSLIGPVTDNWNYQDNILPKYHSILGNEVVMITSKYIYDNKGIIITDNRDNYINEYGIKTIRLKLKKRFKFSSKFKRYINFYNTLDSEKPDLLFIHGLQFRDINIIYKYCKKNKNVKLVIDNHADFSNSASKWLSKKILHGVIWKYYAKKIEKVTTKFWGVTPARVDFLLDMYKIKKDKVGLLLLGADDEIVKEATNNETKKLIRKKYGIDLDDFLIVTGGKIDKAKYQTLLLMDAVNKLNNTKLKLLIFGPVVDDMKSKFNERINNNIIYVPWLDNVNSYKVFGAADLVVFPGRHSVYWEIVASLGVPMITKYWEGMTHISNGKNNKFLYNDSVEEIYINLKNIIENNRTLLEMKIGANSDFKYKFLYSEIAKKSILE